jgi:FSR family fosmidomycin resistance protein-like MFS transporter
MATDTITASIPKDEPKDSVAQAAPILTAHFIHDIYTAAVAPLLPQLKETLSLSNTAAGWLNAIMQLPGLLNPLFGYMADHAGVRYLVILAPATTATLVSLIGQAPNYLTIAILLFAAGISTAAFHAPGPAVVARLSGRRVGLGMGLFMATGELGFAIGPLLVTWAVSQWTLAGIWRLMFIGWGASVFLFWRLRHVIANPTRPGSLRAMFPAVWRLFIPMIFFNLFRNPLMECLNTYLPIYMDDHGASLILAGSALTVVELAGIPGTLLIGPLSDRIGRKTSLLVSAFVSSLLMLVFLRVDGILLFVLLALLGFVSFSAMPVLLAIVQETFPDNRAVANGLYMMLMFVIRPLGTVFVGQLSDHYGLETAFFVAALVSFLMLPAIWALPEAKKK